MKNIVERIYKLGIPLAEFSRVSGISYVTIMRMDAGRPVQLHVQKRAVEALEKLKQEAPKRPKAIA